MKKLDYKWRMLILISTMYFLAQGARQIYNAVLPQMKLDFGGSDTNFGLVSSAFTLVFGLVGPFSGMAADFLHRKWVIITGALVFSAGIFACGFADGLLAVVIAYGVVTAMGQSLMPPSNSSLIGQFHTDTRGTAFAVYQTAIYLGVVCISSVSGWFAGLGSGGWRKAFWCVGIVCAVYALPLVFTLRDSPLPPPDPAKAQEKASVREGLMAFFSKPSAWLLTLALGGYFFSMYGFRCWMPKFFSEVFGLSAAEVGFHSVAWFYLGAFAGVLLAGRLSDRLKKRRPAIRFETEMAGIALCVPFILAMAYAPTMPLMCAAVAAFGFATGVYDSNLYAALLDVVNPRYRAVSVGIFGLGGCIFGACGPAVMGFLNEFFKGVTDGSVQAAMRLSFAASAGAAALGLLAIVIARFFFFTRDSR